MKHVVVLDKIRSLYNVGSIIRTCDAFGIGDVVLCGWTPTPDHKRFEHMQSRDVDAKINKTALKGMKSVAWRHEDSAAEAVKRLKDEGYRVVAIEQHPNSIPLTKTHPRDDKRGLAIVLGNELDGVSPDALALCDNIIEIPMQGEGDSLNVAVAFGIAAHALLDRTNYPNPRPR